MANLGIYLVLLFPSVVYSLICHRCFGNGFCHDPAHTNFSTKVKTVSCTPSNLTFETENQDPWSKEVQKALNQNYQNSFQNASGKSVTEAHCITARVDEPNDSHTLRTCLIETRGEDSTSAVCAFIKNRIESQNKYNGNFSCGQCNDGNLCNIHTFTSNNNNSSNGTTDDTSGFTVMQPLSFITLITFALLPLMQ